MTKHTTKKDSNSETAFDGQRPNEKVLFIFRRHIIAMRKGFYLLLIPFVIASLPTLIFQNNIQDNIGLFMAIAFAGLGVGLVLFSYHYILWYFTVYVVTNQRIRQITQKGFFGKDVIELQLSKIQNISYNIPGFSGEIFKFGTIVIQTIVGDLIINNVEHPEKIYNKLQDAVNDVIQDKEQID